MATNHNNFRMVELWRLFSSTWKTWYRKAEENIATLDISIPEYRMMSYLLDHGPTPMARLASVSYVSQGWITSMVDRLEGKGLLKRMRNEGDRRIIRIAILPDGEETIKEARQMHLDFVTRSFQTFTEKEKKDLRQLLNKLSLNLTAGEIALETDS